MATSARGSQGHPSTPRGSIRSRDVAVMALPLPRAFQKLSGTCDPFPTPLWCDILCYPVLCCTEHLGVHMTSGLISSPLDLFSFGKGDPALFPLFMSPVLSSREPWGWCVKWAGGAGSWCLTLGRDSSILSFSFFHDMACSGLSLLGHPWWR